MALPVGQSSLTQDIAKIKVQGVFEGKLAPDFEAKTLDDKPFRLSELRGKIVLLDFWATWCGPCVAALPNVKKLHEQFGGSGLVVVGISFDRTAEIASKSATEKELSWPQLWAEGADKGTLANLYGVGAIPATFLIGPDGKVIGKDLVGEDLSKAVQRAVKNLQETK